MMNRFVFLLVLAFLPVAAFSQDTEEQEILRRIDSYRLFSEDGFAFHFYLEENDESYEMQVYVRDSNGGEALCRYLQPQTFSGRSILVQEKNFWYFDQDMNAPIRISPRQMLFGQASAGDISRIVYSQFYTLEEATELDDRMVFLLTAREDKECSYYQIVLETEKESLRPIKATCLARTGLAMKVIEYLDYREINGHELLTEMRIINTVNGEESLVRLDGFSLETVPNRFYNKDALRYLP